VPTSRQSPAPVRCDYPQNLREKREKKFASLKRPRQGTYILHLQVPRYYCRNQNRLLACRIFLIFFAPATWTADSSDSDSQCPWFSIYDSDRPCHSWRVYLGAWSGLQCSQPKLILSDRHLSLLRDVFLRTFIHRWVYRSEEVGFCRHG
jgi:hypothetical protein